MINLTKKQHFVKTKTLIKKLLHWLVIPFKYAHSTYMTLSQKLKLYIDPVTNLTFRDMVLVWSLEIISYGLSIYVIYITLFVLTGWKQLITLPLGFGLIRWLLLDLIKAVRNKLLGD